MTSTKKTSTISSGKTTPVKVPMSEDILKKDDSPRSATACIEILRKMAKADPEKIISRNYFRVHSPIAESVWNAHFGTFHEFKRLSGIVLTRQQHQLEREIAKHASVDHYRAIAAERSSWAERYLRPGNGRFKTVLATGDLHDVETDPFFLRVLIDTAKRAQPDVVSYIGDIFDLPEFGKYTVDPREWDVVGRINHVHTKIFKPMRLAAPQAQNDLIEGNHEARLVRMLADATPALRAILADLHGMTIGKLLGLEAYQINYIAKGDLAAYTKRDFTDELRNNYRIYYDAALVHHFPEGRMMGLSGVNGHNHRHQVWSGFNAALKHPTEWHQMGCGHKRDASYCNGEKWNMGFSLINIDTKTRAVAIDYVPVGDFAISGGKWYYRTESEVCAPDQTFM